MNTDIHQTHGRLRIRIGTLENKLFERESLIQDLAALQGVIRVRNNLRTGSIVVEFDPSTTNPDLILRCFKKNNHMRNVIPFPRPYRGVPRPAPSHAEDDALAKLLEVGCIKLFKVAVEVLFASASKRLMSKVLI